MPIILLTIYCLLFIFLAFKNFHWALYLFIFTLPAYLIRFNIFGLPGTFLELEIFFLFIVFLIKNYNKTKKINYQLPTNHRLSFFYFFVVLFLISSTLAIFVSSHPREAAGLWKAYFIEPILFFFIFIKTIKKENLKNIFYILSAQGVLLSILAIYQKFTGDFIINPFWANVATRRVTSIFPYPNALALYLAPTVTLLIGIIVSRLNNIKKQITIKLIGNWKLEIGNYLEIISCFLIIILGFLSIYFTGSKGALVGIFSGLVFYALFFKGYKKYFIGILGITILLIFYLVGTHKINLLGTSTVVGGDSISVRTDMWNETWQMLQQKPLWGAGLAGYQSAVAPFHKKSYIEIYLYPHNIFLNFWSEIGLLGLLAFLGIIFWFYIAGFKLLNTINPIIYKSLVIIPILSAMTTLLVHGLVDVPYFKNDLAILFWLIIGLLVINMIDKEKLQNHNS